MKGWTDGQTLKKEKKSVSCCFPPAQTLCPRRGGSRTSSLSHVWCETRSPAQQQREAALTFPALAGVQEPCSPGVRGAAS